MRKFISPAYNIIAVPIEKIEANDYNPNHVAKREMDLLYQSIKCDGYTMPVVCFYDKEKDIYILVDGYHRHLVMLTHRDIYDRENGMLPVSVIKKDISDRMASTVRHNSCELLSICGLTIFDTPRVQFNAWLSVF